MLDGQLTIFDCLQEEESQSEPLPEKWILDSDVNEIYQKIWNLCSQNRFSFGRKYFTLWDHVPNLGWRLWMSTYFGDNTMPFESFWESLENIVSFAKSKNIELSVMQSPCFGENEKKYCLDFSTMFKDERKKRNYNPKQI